MGRGEKHHHDHVLVDQVLRRQTSATIVGRQVTGQMNVEKLGNLSKIFFLFFFVLEENFTKINKEVEVIRRKD
jgi:hypothetical protein